MNEEEMKDRTRRFALRVMRRVEALPATTAGRALGGQLIRAATSVGANYRAACRGRSKAEFVAKLGIAEEEADESDYWMELIGDGELVQAQRLAALRQEAQELRAILTASRRSAGRALGKIENRKSKIEN